MSSPFQIGNVKPLITWIERMAGLTHTVECRYNGTVWEVIAAFNMDRAAIAYAGECHMSNRQAYGYRVRDVATDSILRSWG